MRWQATFDPGISEWGNPIPRKAGLSSAEFIGGLKVTWGSETSQYPEEKKTPYDNLRLSTANPQHFRVVGCRLFVVSCLIPGVVASETGTAQTWKRLNGEACISLIGMFSWFDGSFSQCVFKRCKRIAS